MTATLVELEALIAKVAAVIGARADPQVVFQAVVTAITTTAGRPSVSLAIGAITVPGVFYAGNYHPAVNDTVMVVYTGSTPFVVCPQTPLAPIALAPVASDLPTAIALANSMRAALISLGQAV